MITYVLGLLISLGAGAWFIYNPPKDKQWIYLFLSAGGAYLIAIIFTHILPELFEVLPGKAGIVLLIGFMIQILLENYSKGIEHGHGHATNDHRALYISFVALCIHALVEGMPLASLISETHIGFDRQLALGIMLHKIPVAFTLATLLVNSGINKNKAFVFVFTFIACTVAGSGLQILIGNQYAEMAEESMFISLGLTIGILLHVSTTILFESNDGHKLNPSKFVVIILGLLLGIFT